MILEPQEADQFIHLYTSLLCDANRRLQFTPESEFGEPPQFGLLSLQTRFDLRQAFLDRRDELLDSFVAENPYHLSGGDLAIVASWRHLVAGKFFVFRYLKNYAVLLDEAEPPTAYGVVALTQPLTDFVGPDLPIWIQTVLVPFRGKIVCDGLVLVHNIAFGPGFRRGLADRYKEAKEGRGIITALPAVDASPAEQEPAKQKPARKSGPKKPAVRKSAAKKSAAAAQEALAVVTGLTDQFCREHLNEEYAALCRKLAEKLARKRPSPLLGGRPSTWACGIVRTIGWVNFLDDRSQKPHMKLTAIDKAFGVGESTGQGKSKEIRRLLKIHQYDYQWMLARHIDDNPLVWMLEVNGFLQDIRDLPREAQEIAFEKGLIPYIPADR